MYGTEPNVSKGFKGDKEGKRRERSASMKVTRLQCSGSFLPIPAATRIRENATTRFTRTYHRNRVKDQVEGAGREKEAKGGIRPETRDLHMYLLVAH